MKLTFARYGILFLIIVGVILISGCVQAPDDQPTIRLEIPDGALPEGVQKTNITIKTISENDLPKNIPALEETDPITTVRLEPDGLQFLKPVAFILTFPSHFLFSPTVYLISDSKTEEVTGFNATYDEDKEIITLKVEISHFSTLAVRQHKSIKAIDEFFGEAKANIAESEAKADSTTYYSEKAKYYKEMVDKASDYHIKAYRKFGQSRYLPQPGRNELGESTALQNYGTNILADIDFKINDEKDPEKRFDLLKERMKTTFDIHVLWGGGAFDERLAPKLGGNDLGESTLLRDQGDSIVSEMQQLIDLEEDTAKKNALKDRLADIVIWLLEPGPNMSFDERLQLDISTLLPLVCKAGTIPFEECDKTCPLSSLCTKDPTQTFSGGRGVCSICNPCPDNSVPTDFCERTHCGLKGEVKCKMVRTAQQCSTCEIESPSCTSNWDCTEFIPDPCFAPGIQTRTCTDTNNCGNMTGKPAESQDCTPCTPNWDCTEFIPEPCPDSAIQTRICTDINDCGTEQDKPAEVRDCIPCTPNWDCTEWSPIPCPDIGFQMRICIDTEGCGIEEGRPEEQRDCTPPTVCDKNKLRSCLQGCIDANKVCVYNCPHITDPLRCQEIVGTPGCDINDPACLNDCSQKYQSCFTACHTSNPPCTLDEVYSVLQEISGG